MIRVLFQTESHYPVGTKKIKNAIAQSLEGRVTRDTEVGVSIVGTRRMRALNRQYRQKDFATDVLSFGLNDPTERQEVRFIDAPDDVLRLGDIIICFPVAREQAAEEHKLVDDKIIELALHGLDHLMGIHHEE